jgi:hypothetical protein
VFFATVEVGHIPGTLRRYLPRSDENRRDLSRRSDRIRGAFALVRETLAQDPAYRPNRLSRGEIMCWWHTGACAIRSSSSSS